MKIKDIIELSKVEPITKIAKNRLEIGEKPTREILKEVGCYSVSGKRGWFYDGDPEVIERSIYEFVKSKPRANVKTKVEKSEKTKKDTSKTTNATKNKRGKTQVNDVMNEQKNTKRRASFDIDVDLLKRLKVRAVMEDKNLYELVEEAIREYLD